MESDAANGQSRAVIGEEAKTFVEVNLTFGAFPNILPLDRSNEVIWFSQADGYAHLYLCDLASGSIIRQLTTGDFPVVQLLSMNEARREILVLMGSPENAADPYLRRLFAVSLDSGAMRLLTPDPLDHTPYIRDLGWAEILETNTANGPLPSGTSPSGVYAVVTGADASTLGETWLCRTTDGARLATLEQGSCDLPLAMPERVEVLAADGQTRLFGMLWRPRDFDPTKSYPLVDWVYPGPHCIQAPRSALPLDALASLARVQAATELGLAVLMMDGRGTPYRSRAFHELCHGNLADPGFLSDHVAAFPQIGATRPWLDLSRIGIIGHSAGGHTAARGILAWPEVFSRTAGGTAKTIVASSAGILPGPNSITKGIR